MEEEHPFSLRSGGDARAGVAVAHRAVAPQARGARRQGLQHPAAHPRYAHLRERAELPHARRGPAPAGGRRRRRARRRRQGRRGRLRRIRREGPGRPAHQPRRRGEPSQVLPPERVRHRDQDHQRRRLRVRLQQAPVQAPGGRRMQPRHQAQGPQDGRVRPLVVALRGWPPAVRLGRRADLPLGRAGPAGQGRANRGRQGHLHRAPGRRGGRGVALPAPAHVRIGRR
mmetsp:Transcript_3328/g.13529  ORF Transcript_3328/g.13529 Transcript_3328/m.13529 type:complete len:227 (-) Transcript_3328:589-1269(-)